MPEIHFVVKEAPEGGYTAKAANADIFTEADDLPTLTDNIFDAVHCHFGDELALDIDIPGKD
jgi:hypothetical protein